MGAFQERAPIRHGHRLATGTATVKDPWYGRARAPPRACDRRTIGGRRLRVRRHRQTRRRGDGQAVDEIGTEPHETR